MKIGKPPDLPLADALSRSGQVAVAGQASGAADARKVERVTATDEVRLSPASRNLASDSADAADPVRAEKVAEVRQAIREGRFQVNAKAVAEKMVTEAAELLETLTRVK